MSEWANKRKNNSILEELQSKLKFTITKLILFLKVQITRARKNTHKRKKEKEKEGKKYRWKLLGMWTGARSSVKEFLLSAVRSKWKTTANYSYIQYTHISQARQLTNEVIQWLRLVECMDGWLVGWMDWMKRQWANMLVFSIRQCSRVFFFLLCSRIINTHIACTFYIYFYYIY